MYVYSESTGCKACEAAKNGVYFTQMRFLGANVTEQMVLYGQIECKINSVHKLINLNIAVYDRQEKRD
ncbi:hypothetical protein ACT29H_16130, partial [Thermophagus sp. OGC60D27]|uniref:hypothetical protein n=1 Tax=Thermophagus sp. OGC60D27 TaxID=3458415 RepID=UPI004037B39A